MLEVRVGNKVIFAARIVATVKLFNINQPLEKQEAQFRGEFCHIDKRDSTQPRYSCVNKTKRFFTRKIPDFGGGFLNQIIVSASAGLAFRAS
jgi:hypothetical protein